MRACATGKSKLNHPCPSPNRLHSLSSRLCQLPARVPLQALLSTWQLGTNSAALIRVAAGAVAATNPRMRHDHASDDAQSGRAASLENAIGEAPHLSLCAVISRHYTCWQFSNRPARRGALGRISQSKGEQTLLPRRHRRGKRRLACHRTIAVSTPDRRKNWPQQSDPPPHPPTDLGRYGLTAPLE